MLNRIGIVLGVVVLSGILMGVSVSQARAADDTGANPDSVVALLSAKLTLTDTQAKQVTQYLTKFMDQMKLVADQTEDADPDPQAMLGEIDAARDELHKNMQSVLTPDQWTTYSAMVDAVLKETFESIAELRIADWRLPMDLTVEQMDKLKPSVGTAIHDVVNVLLEDGDKRMGVRNKLSIANKLKRIQGDMEAEMTKLLSPQQMEKYQAIKEANKKARKK